MDKLCSSVTNIKKIANAVDIEYQQFFQQLRYLSHMSEDIEDLEQLTNIFSNLKQNDKDKILNFINTDDEFTYECAKCSNKNGYFKREIDTLDISKLKTVLYATGILQ